MASTGPSQQPPQGLSSEEALRLLQKVGPNVVTEAKGPSLWRQFLANFVQLLALLLWVGAALAFIAGMPELSAGVIVAS